MSISVHLRKKVGRHAIAAQSVKISFLSQQIGDRRTRRDTCRRDHPGKRCKRDFARRIKSIQRKGAGKVITIRPQCDRFGDTSRTYRHPDPIIRVSGELVGEPGKVI